MYTGFYKFFYVKGLYIFKSNKSLFKLTPPSLSRFNCLLVGLWNLIKNSMCLSFIKLLCCFAELLVSQCKQTCSNYSP